MNKTVEPNANNDDKPKLTRIGMELDKSMALTRAAELELVPALAVEADSTIPVG